MSVCIGNQSLIARYQIASYVVQENHCFLFPPISMPQLPNEAESSKPWQNRPVEGTSIPMRPTYPPQAHRSGGRNRVNEGSRNAQIDSSASDDDPEQSSYQLGLNVHERKRRGKGRVQERARQKDTRDDTYYLSSVVIKVCLVSQPFS